MRPDIQGTSTDAQDRHGLHTVAHSPGSKRIHAADDPRAATPLPQAGSPMKPTFLTLPSAFDMTALANQLSALCPRNTSVWRLPYGSASRALLAPHDGSRGRPAAVSDAAIQCCLTITALFKLPLRHTGWWPAC